MPEVDFSGALSGERVYSELFSLTEESEMGHLRLAREADLVIVAVPLMGDLEKTGNLIAGSRAELGRVGIGVAVWHSGTPGKGGTLSAPPLTPTAHAPAGWGGTRKRVKHTRSPNAPTQRSKSW